MKLSRKDRIRKKHFGIRKKIFGTTEKPRLCVYKSRKHFHLQIIDDEKQITLVSASTTEKNIANAIETENKSNAKAAKLVAEALAKRANEKNIKQVVFDRGGFIYSKNLKILADTARENGLEF